MENEKHDQRLTENFYEIAAIEALTGILYNRILFHGNADRARAIVSYDQAEKIPEGQLIVAIKTVDGLIEAPLLPTEERGASFEEHFIRVRKNILDQLKEYKNQRGEQNEKCN